MLRETRSLGTRFLSEKINDEKAIDLGNRSLMRLGQFPQILSNNMSSVHEQLPSVDRKGILVLHRSGQPITTKPPPVYICLSGFPDDSSTFSSFAKPLEERYHVVKLCYPDMDQETLGNFWGYSMSQVEMALVAVIQEYRTKYKCSKIFLHGFDWGAAITLRVVQNYPHIVTKLIEQDIGIINLKELSLYDRLVITAYQGFLAFVFLLSRLFMGNDKLAAWIIGFLPFCFPWFLLFTNAPSGISAKMRPHRCYPYFRIIADILTGKLLESQFAATVPQFFAYGAKKNISFHTPDYIQSLEATPGCRCKAYDGGHWFHTTHEAEFQKDVLEFLEE